MSDQEEQQLNVTNREERRSAEEARQLAKEQIRKKAYMAREEAIEKASKERQTRQAEKRATEEIGKLAKGQTRRKALLAKEQAIAEAQEARKLKAKNQPPG